MIPLLGSLLLVHVLVSSNPSDDRQVNSWYLLYGWLALTMIILLGQFSRVRLRLGDLARLPKSSLRVTWWVLLAFGLTLAGFAPAFYQRTGLLLVACLLLPSKPSDGTILKFFALSYSTITAFKVVMMLHPAYLNLLAQGAFTNIGELLTTPSLWPRFIQHWVESHTMPQLTRSTDLILTLSVAALCLGVTPTKAAGLNAFLSIFCVVALYRKTIVAFLLLLLPFKYLFLVVPLGFFAILKDKGSIADRFSELFSRPTLGAYDFYHLGHLEANRLAGPFASYLHIAVGALGIWILIRSKLNQHSAFHWTLGFFLTSSFFHPVLFRGPSVILIAVLLTQCLSLETKQGEPNL